VSGAVQVEAQVPMVQTCPVVHARPQAPQFAGSEPVATQVPLHDVVPGGQPAHLPLLQV
jgi:hypothetical protein